MKSWVEISAAKLAHNLRAVQAVAGADVEILAVVKANGYGHGAEVVAPTLAAAGAKWLGVTDIDEGMSVRALEPGVRIVVMCGMDHGDAEALVANDITQVVWTPGHIHALNAAARAVGHNARVHLEVDTGMGRQGASVGDDLAMTLAALQASEFVECEGLMTHLCESEVANSPVTKSQLGKFAQAIEQTTDAGVQPKLLHLGNTSAVDEGSTMQWVREQAQLLNARAMVRPGLAIYGHCLPLAHGHLAAQIQPALTWKTHVIGVRDVVAGDTVGYGATFTATQPMKLALIPVGYADGFRRAASSGIGSGWVVLAGQRAPIVGRVSMNLTVVDVSAIAGVQVGDIATVLGEGVTAEDHAAWSQTIAYDILCGIRARVELV